MEPLAEQPGERLVGRRAAQHEGVVEARNDLLAHDALQIAEIHHHAALGVRLIRTGAPLDRHEKTVRMAVNLAAGAVVSLEGVRRLEGELLGKSDCCHSEQSYA